MLVTLILMLLLAGVVELGFLMNNYLHLFDAAREAARFSSSSIAIAPNGMAIDDFYFLTAAQTIRTMEPVIARGTHGDDIIISVFAAQGTHVDRYPSSEGWSLCTHHNDLDNAALLNGLPTDISSGTFLLDWEGCGALTSKFTDQQIEDLLVSSAPPSGILLVEIYYHEDQILNLPLFSDFLPNPIPVYVYTVMPIASAEPTAVH
jgi:hypothetical protein